MTEGAPRVAVVTGAGQGIGAGIALCLAKGGFAVGIIDVDAEAAESTARAVRALGAPASGVRADVSVEADVQRAMETVTASLGAPLVLVNNAGFARDTNLRDMTLGDWEDVQAVHLRGSFLASRAVLPAMERRRWGRIIQVSSISAEGHAGRANYCAAKAGMHGFVKGLAVELGPVGVTVNAVAPGLIVTRMTEATAARRGLSLEDHLTDAVSRIPVGRAGRPEDIGALVTFLSGEDAGFITGQVIYVAGGV